MRKRRRRRKKRFCRRVRAAIRNVSRAVCHLRHARELTCKESVEVELTDEIATLPRSLSTPRQVTSATMPEVDL